MDVELPSTHVVPIARPGIRPQTRSKVIEILAGNANGCLQELGYSPGLIERIRYLEDAMGKLKTTNETLHSDNKNLRARADQAEELHKTAVRYQSENVQLYEDNTKLVGDCDLLRAELSSLRQQIVETRGKDVAEILNQYMLLKNQYADAVKDVQRLSGLLNHYAHKAQQQQPRQQQQQQQQPLASGSQPPRDIRPTQVTVQQLRRVSAPQLQSLPTPNPTLLPRMHSHPHPNVSTHGQPPHPLVGTQPHSRPISIRVPVQTQTMPHPHRQNSAPIGWTPQHGSPLSTPVSAPAAPPPGYGLYAMNSNTNVTNPMSYRPASGTSASAGTSTGPRTPTFLPTPPMSALPLNLQNFASPGLVQAHAHAHPGPPRTASAASSVKSPALPPVSFSMPVPPLPVQSMPQEPEPQALPPEAPAPLEMQMQADGGREMQEVQPEAQDAGREMQEVQLETQDAGREMQDVQPEAQDTGREMQEVQPEVQDIGREMQDVPLEAQDAGSPPEAHEAVTPPVDAVGPPAIALNPGIGADIDDGGLQPRPKKEDAEPPEKMEVDEDDEEEDDDDEDGDDVGYIELGPDGLRTVRDCVAAVFDPEDEYVCRFCQARYQADTEKGVPSELPPRMRDATLEERAEHCEKEHEYAWGLLRSNV